MVLPKGLTIINGKVVIDDYSLVAKLTDLHLSELFLVNKITEVKGLSTLTILTNLNLSGNPLLNIRYLPKSNNTLNIYIDGDHESLLEQGFLSLHSITSDVAIVDT